MEATFNSSIEFMNHDKKTYLFIGGAPKSGTTSLFDDLAGHPRIIGAEPKETFYFMNSDYSFLNAKNNFHKSRWKGFDSFFPSEKYEVYLEGTTHLLFQYQMIPILLEKEHVKLIFVLRNPVERIRSAFEYTKNNLGGVKGHVGFSEYVDALLENDKRAIKNMMYADANAFGLQNELWFSTYHLHLEKWCSLVPNHQIKIFSFEQYTSNRKGVVGEILNWLNVIDNERIVLGDEVSNSTYKIKRYGLHRLSLKLSRIFPEGALKEYLKRQYLNRQTHSPEGEKQEDDEASMRKLSAYFEEPNVKLKKYMDHDW